MKTKKNPSKHLTNFIDIAKFQRVTDTVFNIVEKFNPYN